MKKSTRLLKRLMALFLIVLISINTFAAVVGDNDGAAFITKAEFDSMKTDFQSQLDNYNSSIDNKIDGAISSYLEGIKISKKENIKFINNQSVYKSLTSSHFEEGRFGLAFEGAQYVRGWDEQVATSAGVSGFYRATIDETPSFGNLLDTRFSVTGKDGIYLGYGQCRHFISANAKSYHSTAQNGAGYIDSRSRRWQLFWWTGSLTASTDYPTGTNYYPYFCPYSNPLNVNWAPLLFGLQQSSTYRVGSNDKAKITGSTHNYSVGDAALGLINDETLGNAIDAFSINGITLRPEETTVGTLDVYLSAVANQPTASFMQKNDNNVFWVLATTYGWTEIYTGYYCSATLSITDFNTTSQTGNNFKYFDGKNHLLYLSHIDNPGNIFTGVYSTEKFEQWLALQPSPLGMLYENRWYWNMRYGSLLLHESETEAHYDLTVKNDTTLPIGMKIIKSLDTTIFEMANGIKTDQSDETDKNKITIPAESTIKIGFDVVDNDPVFFKCSDGAAITLIELVKSTE